MNVKKNIVERCRDLITGNIEQYKLLMYLPPEDRLTEAESFSSSSLTSMKNEPANEPISLPDPYSTDEQMKFECTLSEFGISGLNLESLRDTCHELLIEGKCKISEELIQVLQRPEYMELSLDMTTLIQRYSATAIESTSVTHDSSCYTDTVWNAERADSNLNIMPDEMTTNAFHDSNHLFDDIATHISDGQQHTLDNVNNYTEDNYFILYQLDSASQVIDYILVIYTSKNNSLANIDNMMVESPSTIVEEDSTSFNTTDNIHEIKETIRENEEKTSHNKKYHVVFKPNFAPISRRLRRKK
ncbi:unnamed protein product [Rotaria socialis]|uniref:Uncharacterized protein n=1 Tax=Rotaria socialis TaxID=392032 RepID=A0A820G7C6_9BILA|nr:unnamed protein product [Rotaria socialis]CAF4273311.1 unnamed protein product [Rotaria socialis]CAF4530426.1 unnamed protein product [Rotaria socialis]CAF4603724.1 unnamed protein product [Rotaria socialis]CAF4788512.1 unnamed protein product [Rotaria socialis]